MAGAALVLLTLAAAVALGRWALGHGSVPALAVAATLGVSAAVAAVGFWWGAHANDGTIFERPAPAVTGLDLAEARRLLTQPGPVRIVVKRDAWWAPRGRVIAVRGVEFDGTYTNRSRIVLVVGTKPPRGGGGAG